jgi:hypothetical protein
VAAAVAVAPDAPPVPAAAADGKQVAAVVVGAAAPGAPLLVPAAAADGKQAAVALPVAAAVVPDAPWSAPVRSSSSAAAAEVATVSPCLAAADCWEVAVVQVSPMPAPDRSVVAAVTPVSRRHSTAVVAAAEARPVRHAAEPEAASRSKGCLWPAGIPLRTVGRQAARA